MIERDTKAPQPRRPIDHPSEDQGGVYYAEDFDPNEIFNMFFGCDPALLYLSNY